VSQHSPHRSNRRASIRNKPRRVRCRCHQGTLGLGPNLALSLLELSQTGASLLVKTALEPNQPVELELDGACYPKTVRVEARVVRSAPAPDGAYHVGLRFKRDLPAATLSRLT
jgi:hypothetical protein